MKLYPAGALVLILGMICILAIPPSGLFITEFLIFKGLVFNGQWLVMIIAIIPLCYVIYAMSTRFMHIIFSNPRRTDPVAAAERSVLSKLSASSFSWEL